MIVDKVRDLIRLAINEAGFTLSREVPLDVPPSGVDAHYASAVSLSLSKEAGKSPRSIADSIVSVLKEKIEKDPTIPISHVEVAGAGFINLKLGRSVLASEVNKAATSVDQFGNFDELSGKHVLCEYSCPNPFKPLHVGHLMSNSIGESLSRLYEKAGAKVTRVTYGGDIGLHVAKTIWGMKNISTESKEGIRFVGESYAYGSNSYEENQEIKEEIDSLNKRIFNGEMSQEEKDLYEKGRSLSIEHFRDVYKNINSKFDAEVWEREVEKRGKEVVVENLGKVFEESDGAIVFKGNEEEGLHTRVFVTSKGLPTYEGKEIGWTLEKEDRWHPDLMVLVTASEQTQYYRVVMSALSKIVPLITKKISHVSHGMMRLSGGKFSSRKGDAPMALDLLESAKEKVREVLASREITPDSLERITNDVAVAAIKYQILKQSPGKDIVFDLDTATAIDGDSGPYIQYSAVRAATLIKKAEEAGIKVISNPPVGEFANDLEMAIARLPEIFRRSYREFSPQLLANHLISISALFNHWYDTVRVVGEDPKKAGWRLNLVKATKNALESGLYCLGIAVPEKM